MADVRCNRQMQYAFYNNMTMLTVRLTGASSALEGCRSGSSLGGSEDEITFPRMLLRKPFIHVAPPSLDHSLQRLVQIAKECCGTVL